LGVGFYGCGFRSNG